MNLAIKPSLKLTAKRMEKLLTKEEIDLGLNVAFRATISSSGHYVKAERLNRSVGTLEVGGNAEILDNGNMVVDAIVMAVSKGDLMPGVGVMRKDTAFICVAPLITIENPKGYFFENFTLRSPFLPLSEDLLNKYESLSLGIATVDIETQTVKDIEVVSQFDSFYCRNREIGDCDYYCKEGEVKIVCKLANAGCNFGCYIK